MSLTRRTALVVLSLLFAAFGFALVVTLDVEQNNVLLACCAACSGFFTGNAAGVLVGRYCCVHVWSCAFFGFPIQPLVQASAEIDTISVGSQSIT